MNRSHAATNGPGVLRRPSPYTVIPDLDFRSRTQKPSDIFFTPWPGLFDSDEIAFTLHTLEEQGRLLVAFNRSDILQMHAFHVAF